MSVRFVELRAGELAAYRDGLRQLERDIEYPIADGADHFHIDHGARYEDFFLGLGKEPIFLLALDGDRVVGTFTGVVRDAVAGDRSVATLYGADFKLARGYR